MTTGAVAGALIALLIRMPAASGVTLNATPENVQAVLDKAKPGDTIVLADGVYRGGITMSRSGAAEAPITVKAEGGKCIVDGGRRDGFVVEHASYVTVEGMRFQNAGRAGLGVLASAEAPADRVTVRKCVFADNGMWGCVTSHINHFTIEDCEAFGSKIQHGIYVANSGDDPIVRRNRIHDNNMCGLHVNGDPEMGGDGVISRALIERNVISRNGKEGGSAINMTHVQDSLVRNNLLYDNLATGIALYYDTGGDSHASKRNQLYNNTVFFRPGEGRFSLLARRDSSDCKVINNIFVGGKYGVALIEPSCLAGLTINKNVYATYPGQVLIGDSSEESAEAAKAFTGAGLEVKTTKGMEVTVASWRKAGFDKDSSFGEMPRFVDAAKGDFHLAAGSVGIAMGLPLYDLVPEDLDGKPRVGKASDCGAYSTGAAYINDRAGAKEQGK